MRLAALLVFCATTAFGDVSSAVREHILPGLQSFETSAAALNQATNDTCDFGALVAPFHTAFDQWMRISDVRIGPSESGALSIAFWPDKKGFTEKALGRLLAEQDEAALSPANFVEVSIAARGFFALERMLFDPDFRSDDGYGCALVRAISGDLARQAAELNRDWRQGFATTLTTAGADGNTVYLDETEATRAIYTQVLTSLENTIALRLGRPLGENAGPKPRRAEAWRSGRSLQNVLLSVQSAVDLSNALADWELPKTMAALELAYRQADHIGDPSFQDITDLQRRFAVEALAQRVEGVKQAIEVEVGGRYGITPGFNASDGD